MSLKLSGDGKVVIETSMTSQDLNEVILRMEALIGLIQFSSSETDVTDERYFTLELLKDMLPNESQLNLYLSKTESSSN